MVAGIDLHIIKEKILKDPRVRRNGAYVVGAVAVGALVYGLVCLRRHSSKRSNETKHEEEEDNKTKHEVEDNKKNTKEGGSKQENTDTDTESYVSTPSIIKETESGKSAESLAVISPPILLESLPTVVEKNGLMLPSNDVVNPVVPLITRKQTSLISEPPKSVEIELPHSHNSISLNDELVGWEETDTASIVAPRSIFDTHKFGNSLENTELEDYESDSLELNNEFDQTSQGEISHNDLPQIPITTQAQSIISNPLLTRYNSPESIVSLNNELVGWEETDTASIAASRSIFDTHKFGNSLNNTQLEDYESDSLELNNEVDQTSQGEISHNDLPQIPITTQAQSIISNPLLTRYNSPESIVIEPPSSPSWNNPIGFENELGGVREMGTTSIPEVQSTSSYTIREGNNNTISPQPLNTSTDDSWNPSNDEIIVTPSKKRGYSGAIGQNRIPAIANPYNNAYLQGSVVQQALAQPTLYDILYTRAYGGETTTQVGNKLVSNNDSEGLRSSSKNTGKDSRSSKILKAYTWIERAQTEGQSEEDGRPEEVKNWKVQLSKRIC
ncbi:3655_t:CDS:2 [Ambispora gerdemannii]|uniref:3655_t:CDS:1 n=1 Tax=Ambispora gerdemannii TaxID=144530 RepID=A0A9N8ZKI2_9GLOM|nr:3655_t:CDS:2 [Ambispora gerdemannii]